MKPRHFERKDEPYRFLCFSFDDSVTQDIRFIELLDKHGFVGTFNLNSGQFGMRDMIGPPTKRVPHDGIEAQYINGIYENHECAGHTKTHPALDELSADEITDEVDGDRRAIEALTGEKVIGMAYPGENRFNGFVIKVIAESTPLIYARTARFTHSLAMPTPDKLLEWDPSCHFFDDDLLSLAKELSECETDCDLCLMIVGHTYELDIAEKWDEFDSVLARLSELPNITNASCGEIALYIKEKGMK